MNRARRGKQAGPGVLVWFQPIVVRLDAKAAGHGLFGFSASRGNQQEQECDLDTRQGQRD